MKCLGVITKGLLIIGLTVVPHLANAGGAGPGGGFYGYVNGQWILIDDLEEGKVIQPEKEPYFAPVESVLKQVDQTVPGFGEDLRVPLKSKTWHLVPFPISCEEPKSAIQVNAQAGACQDENDVFIEEAKFSAAAKHQLIIHELIQARRISINKGRASDNKLGPETVRGLKRVLTANPFPNEEGLKNKISSYGFGDYLTYSNFKKKEQKLAREKAKLADIEQLYNSATRLSHMYCNEAILDVQRLKDAANASHALSVAFREAGWVAEGGGSDVSQSAQDLYNFRRFELASDRENCDARIRDFAGSSDSAINKRKTNQSLIQGSSDGQDSTSVINAQQSLN